jgi:hypothetical protein
MRKHSVLLTLAVVEALAEALLVLYFTVMRTDLGYPLDATRSLPIPTRVAVSDWFAPVVAVIGALPVLLALLPRWRTKTRTYLAATGVVFTVFGLVFAVYAAYAPAFGQLER